MKPASVALLVGVMLASLARSADAQGRPYRGLFGSGVAQDAEQSLTATASFGTGYDDDLRAEARGGNLGGGGVNPANRRAGALNSFSGAISYSVDRETFSLNASGGTAGRYYPSVEPSTISSERASIGARWTLSPRTQFSSGTSAFHRPFGLTDFLPVGDALPSDGVPGVDSPADTTGPIDVGDPLTFDQAGTQRSYFGHLSNANLSHRLTRRSTLDLGYSFRAAAASGLARESQMHGANAGVHFSVARGFGWRLGYALRRRYFGDGDANEVQQFIVGIDYSRALSFSRRTTLSFGTGTASTKGTRGRTTYRATGTAALVHQIGRTWSATAGYTRGFRFIDTLAEPIFADSVSVVVGGLISRRLQFSSGTHAALGNTIGRRFDTYYQSFSLQTAVNRFVSISTTYSYFLYQFNQDLQLPPGVAREIGRQSMRVQASVWTPIFQRARRNNASR